MLKLKDKNKSKVNMKLTQCVSAEKSSYKSVSKQSKGNFYRVTLEEKTKVSDQKS